MIQKAKTISYDARQRAFWVLATISLLSIVIYIGAIEMTVHNTVTRQTLQNQSTDLSTVVSEMEFQDIALKNNVNLDLAYAHGFKDVTAPIYISRSVAASLSMNVPTDDLGGR
jgi:hypothetical protein